MPLHIGVVGCFAEVAAFCYRTICAEAAALLHQAHAHPAVSMHTPSLADDVDGLSRGDLDGVAALKPDPTRLLARPALAPAVGA